MSYIQVLSVSSHSTPLSPKEQELPEVSVPGIEWVFFSTTLVLFQLNLLESLGYGPAPRSSVVSRGQNRSPP